MTATKTVVKVALITRVEVEGEIVAPGLAITPYVGGDGRLKADGLYCLTHIDSGQRIGTVYCAHRIRAAVAIAIASGADWTGTQDELKANAAAREAHQECISAAYCAGCDNDGNSRGWA